MFFWLRVLGGFAQGEINRKGYTFFGLVFLVFQFLLLLIFISALNAQESFPQYEEGQLIIKFVDRVTEGQKKELRARVNSVTLRKFPSIGAQLIRISGVSVEEAISLFKNDPRIVYVEPNYIWHACIVSNDPDFDLLWGMHNTGQTGGTVDADIDVVDAWNIGTGDSVIIGVIDTGLDTAHVDLRGNIWTNPGEIPNNAIDDDSNGYVDDIHGWDFVNWDNDPSDDNSHGTHCSGIIAAIGDNSTGVVGVCWSAKIMALKFLNSSGEGTTEDAVLALEYATRMGARLTSNSWGGGGYSQALKDAIDSSGAQRMLFVAAAGNAWNNNDVHPFYPSSYDLDNIITVAASDHFDSLVNELNWGSNYGLTSVDLAAPGVNIYSTTPGDGYGYKSGTSMAAPHVSGTVALIWSEHPSLTHFQMKDLVMNTVDQNPDLIGKCVSGGRLNAFMPLAESDSASPSSISDVTVINTEATRITLSWSATGDDSSTGRASYYDVRYSFSPINSSNFNSTHEAFGEPNPQSAGSTETFVVTGLDFNTTYYFAIKAYDEWNNRSGVSNSPWGKTLGPPEIKVSPDYLSDSIFVNGSSSQRLNIANLEQGELFYEINVEYPTLRDSSDDFVFASQHSPFSGEANNIHENSNFIGEVGLDITGGKVTVRTKDVLLVYADDGASSLKSILERYPNIGDVDLWYSGCSGGIIPTLSDLKSYDVVVAWNHQVWEDMHAIGDVLADYIDYGGAVVTMVDCWSASIYASRGRYFEEKGYSPFKSLGEALFEPRMLGWYDSFHPIMDGVGSLAIRSFYSNTALTDGALEVARWDDGTPLIAINPHTVAINIWPGDRYYWTGDFPTLIHNAVNYVASGTFWLSTYPDSGEVAPFSDTDLDVNFNARNSEGGDYQGKILIKSNDPDDSLISVRVWLHVIDSPDIKVDSDSLNFGVTYIGYPESLSLLVSNEGTEVLKVAEVYTENTELSVDIPNLILSPDEDTMVSLTFSPNSVGELWSHLVISSDDPDESTLTVSLRGEGLECADIWVDSDSLSDALFVREVLVETLTVVNSGKSPLYLEVDLDNFAESTGLMNNHLKMSVSSTTKGRYTIRELLGAKGKRSISYDPNAGNTSGLYDEEKDGFLNAYATPGDVLVSWPAPSSIFQPWGLCFDGKDVWISDLKNVTDSEVDTLGNMMSMFSCSDWAGAWSADMAWDGQCIWQVSVGGDNGIYQLDPASGEVLNSIHDPAHKWDSISQRGLAYDKRKDVFYIGGWNQDRVYRIKGLSWDNPGGILNSFYFPAVSGLAWHPEGFLWIAVNARGDYIYQVDPETGEVINQFLAPGDGSGYDGAGLALDRWGNLWCVSQATDMVYLVESGVPAYTWLEVAPWACTLGVGETQELVVKFDASGLSLGDYSADIKFSSNDCDQPYLSVPTRFHLIDLPDSVEPGPEFTPVLDSIGSYGVTGEDTLEFIVEETNQLEFTLYAHDPNEDSLCYFAFGLPERAWFDSISGKFSWIPDYGEVGEHYMLFAVSDGALTDTAYVTITVTNEILEVVGHYPDSSEEDVLIDTELLITLSEPINFKQEYVDSFFEVNSKKGGILKGVCGYNYNARQFDWSLISQPMFPPLDTIVVTLSAEIKDLADSGMAQDFTWEFYTGLGVYPGNTNNDHIVDQRDILALGFYWGETGPCRRKEYQDIKWSIKPVHRWASYSPKTRWDPESAVYADANGDGEVSGSDICAVSANWDSTVSGYPHKLNKGIDLFKENYQEHLSICEEIYNALMDCPESEGENQVMEFLEGILEKKNLPTRFDIHQNYPNPFNISTVIRYSLPQDSRVKITIYNIQGQKVKQLVNEHQSAGHKSVVWDGKNNNDKAVASGVYFYRIQTDDFVSTKKMLLLK
ncbi:MAG: S8 family serine peptidase [Candidatus Zixiibacteriota bacterium]